MGPWFKVSSKRLNKPGIELMTLVYKVNNLNHYTLDASITKTSPCKEDPLTPHFYKVKLGFTGIYIFFLFLLQSIDCGYSLEPPQ